MEALSPCSAWRARPDRPAGVEHPANSADWRPSNPAPARRACGVMPQIHEVMCVHRRADDLVSADLAPGWRGELADPGADRHFRLKKRESLRGTRPIMTSSPACPIAVYWSNTRAPVIGIAAPAAPCCRAGGSILMASRRSTTCSDRVRGWSAAPSCAALSSVLRDYDLSPEPGR